MNEIPVHINLYFEEKLDIEFLIHLIHFLLLFIV